jgi:hypothetical protein
MLLLPQAPFAAVAGGGGGHRGAAFVLALLVQQFLEAVRESLLPHGTHAGGGDRVRRTGSSITSAPRARRHHRLPAPEQEGVTPSSKKVVDWAATALSCAKAMYVTGVAQDEPFIKDTPRLRLSRDQRQRLCVGYG